MSPDLIATRGAGRGSALEHTEQALAMAASPACAHAFVHTMGQAARAAAAAPANAGRPLAGLPVSVKDLFDIDGQPTAAGSVALADAPAAAQDSAAVARLRAAGAALVGRTNMSEFAFSGVGVNPHHGTPANPADSTVARIPGGSSSGAAVSVATGAAFIGLGSDTGGSIRIPAALCGIVGFKPSFGRVSREGVKIYAQSFDTVGWYGRSVDDVALLASVLGIDEALHSTDRPGHRRIAITSGPYRDRLASESLMALALSKQRLKTQGHSVQSIELRKSRWLQPPGPRKGL